MILEKVKIYILGLHRNFRGERLHNFLREQGYDVEIFWGYTSDDLAILRTFTNVQKSEFLYGRDLTWPEIACNLGHRKIIEKAFFENLECVVILEDDIVINDPFWLKSQIAISKLSEYPSLTLLLTDSRLSLTKKSIMKNSSLEKNKRIYSNPSPTAAYLLNGAALEKISRLPERDWHGTQADFPPVLSRELILYDASHSTEPYPIALLEVESTISSSRGRTMSRKKHILWYFHKVLFLGYFQGRAFGLDFKTYCYHFIGRRIAWKLSQAKMPTQGS